MSDVLNVENTATHTHTHSLGVNKPKQCEHTTGKKDTTHRLLHLPDGIETIRTPRTSSVVVVVVVVSHLLLHL